MGSYGRMIFWARREAESLHWFTKQSQRQFLRRPGKFGSMRLGLLNRLADSNPLWAIGSRDQPHIPRNLWSPAEMWRFPVVRFEVLVAPIMPDVTC